MIKKKFQIYRTRRKIKDIRVRTVLFFSKIRCRPAPAVAFALRPLFADGASGRNAKPDRAKRRERGHEKRVLSAVLWLKSGATIAISILIIFTVVRAGNITPPTGTPVANFYTLSEIYEFITNNTTATEGGHDFTFSSALAGTGRTLTEIYSALASLISADQVKLGTTYLNVTGTYSGYPGTAWSGSGLSSSTCADAASWEWFEDANGDGDEIDSEDGICVKTSTVISDSWNGAEQMVGNGCYPTACDDNNECPEDGTDKCATSTDASTLSTLQDTNASSWTTDKWKNYIVKIEQGTAVGCWGRVKSNDANTLTLYGSWLTSAYASDCGTPDRDSYYKIYDDDRWDNSFIPDYTCDGTAFPNGSVTLGSYPDSGTIALAVADCYDGTRDLLPNESDRAVISGTATAAGAASITDSSLSLNTNVWIGQKVLITGGTGENSYGFIESNTATAITVADWIGGDDPAVSSTFSIIYITPHAGYTKYAEIDGDDNNPKENNGPLMAEHLKEQKGTRLPTHNDFFGFCGATSGDSDGTAGDSAYYSSGASDDQIIGNYGGNVARGNNSAPYDEYMDLSNTSWEWLSEQHNYYSARVAGDNACSYFNGSYVYGSTRFRSVFRP